MSQFLSLVLSRVRQDVTVLHFSGAHRPVCWLVSPSTFQVMENGSLVFLDFLHGVGDY